MACASDRELTNFGFVKLALEQIHQLTDVDSLDDPEDDPFKSKYKARELLESLRKKLDVFIELNSNDTDDAGCVSNLNSNASGDHTILAHNFAKDHDDLSLENIDINCEDESFDSLSSTKRVQIFLRYIEGKLGMNFIECEETSSGEDHISRALQGLNSKFNVSTPWTVYVHLYLLNQLGILHAARRNNEKASEVLHQAECVYVTYKTEHATAPFHPNDLIASLNGISTRNCRYIWRPK